ncbi:MAG: sulfatase [Alphaproteobacteria bacterium]|nr:sulfatase [Alphaproteobacteria bacterium]
MVGWQRALALGAVGLAAAAATWGPDLVRKRPVQVIADPDDEEEGEDRPPTAAATPEPPRAAARPGAPNVVLIFGCTVRRDQLPTYGGPDTMPWLAGLAAEGSVFDDALSVSSWTRASAVGVLTGRHPLSFDLPEPGPRQSERMLPAAATTLAEVLHDAGYATLGGTANPNLNAQYGMAQGFDAYRDANNRAFRQNRTGEQVVDDALAALDARDPDLRGRPFYLQLMLIDAHHPRRPDPATIEAWRAPGVSETVAVYRASLARLDAALARLDEGLKARGHGASDTLFVFVADHGEGLDLPAHHGPGHGKKMYGSTVRIPWIVRGPGVGAGRRIEGLASGVDVLPTLAGLLDVQTPKGADGHDLSAWVRGDRSDVLPRERAFAYSMFHRADVGSVWTRDRQCQQFFEHDHDKTVTGCFDRQADPGFASPIADPPLLEELLAWRLARMAEGAGTPIEKTHVSDEVAEQLEALGYADE